MGKKFVIMAVIALFFGSVSVVAADYWLKNNVQTIVKTEPTETVQSKPERKIVVAGEALSYGQIISADNMREVAWAASDMPTGAFQSIDEMLEGGERAALKAIELGEPVLSSKITGPDARPTLSTLLSPGMRAMAIRIDVVAGVSGFIVPGDRVDVMLVRRFQTRGGENGSEEATIAAAKSPNSRSVPGETQDMIVTTEVLPNIKVLAIDQIASDRQAEPVIAGSATIEVSPSQATLVSSAQSAGQLTLHLRKAGEAPDLIAANDTPQGIDPIPTSSYTSEPPKTSRSVRVRLGDETQTHEVKIEGVLP